MRYVVGWLGIGLCGALTLAGCSGSSSATAPPDVRTARDRQGSRQRGPDQHIERCLPTGFSSSLGTEPVSLVVAAGQSVTLLLSGAARDDPTQPDGMCRAAEEETPSRWGGTIGSVVLQFPNLGDPGPNNIPSVYGCHGAIGVAALLGT